MKTDMIDIRIPLGEDGMSEPPTLISCSFHNEQIHSLNSETNALLNQNTCWKEEQDKETVFSGKLAT